MNKKLKMLFDSDLTCKGEAISMIEKKSFEAFLIALNRVTVVYRYVGDSYLEKQYRTTTNNVSLLSELLFLYGDKGKLFYEKLDQRNYNIDIAEKSDIVFRFIYKKLKKVFVDKALNSPNSIDAICAFCKNEPSFISFWENLKEEEWLNMMKKLGESEKQHIKDYYVSLLHTIGLAGYGRNSYFLSTSRCSNISDKLGSQENGIEIVGWTRISPKNVISYKKSEELSILVEALGLPVVSHVVFPDQEEITYKCGILPHFIIGYYYGENNFEINPYVFKKQNLSAICKNGLKIDQNLFYQRLNEVGYKSTFIELDDMFFQISDITPIVN